MSWDTSKRRIELPPDWMATRAECKRRAGGRCKSCGVDASRGQCDHIEDPHDHGQQNLQWLCVPCHAAKTRRESDGARGLGRRRAVQQPIGLHVDR